MSKYTVITTTIVDKQKAVTADGRCFEFLEIDYKDFHFLPGQFVMIQVDNGTFDWSYPYMILRTTEKGFLVTAVPQSSLYDKKVGSRVSLWGANGRGFISDSPITLVCEPATAFLVAPFIHLSPKSSMIFIGSQTSSIPELCPIHTTFIPTPEKVAELLNTANGKIILALNYPSIMALMEHANMDLKNRTLVFASTDISCGINACKGCYLHSPHIKVGIPVCCEGPYLPYDQIDFITDAKCFHYFQ